MGKFVLQNPYIEVNGVSFSAHTNKVTVTMQKDEVDTTNFGGSGRERVQGLSDDSFAVTFQQDFAASQVDETLYPLYDDGTEFTVIVRPTSGSKSATNPEYSATCMLFTYTPLDGKPGDLSTADIKFTAQRAGITRATS